VQIVSQIGQYRFIFPRSHSNLCVHVLQEYDVRVATKIKKIFLWYGARLTSSEQGPQRICEYFMRLGRVKYSQNFDLDLGKFR